MSLLLRFAPYIAALAAAGFLYWWVFHMGVVSERNSNAGRVLVESEDSRKLREGNDADARRLDDAAALLCLRNPGGCRE